MPLLLAALVFLILSTSLVGLGSLMLWLMNQFLLAAVFLCGLWVVACIAAHGWLQERGKTDPRFATLAVVWDFVFAYTTLYQGVLMTTLVLWGFALVFRGAAMPGSYAQWVNEFAYGATCLAVMILGVVPLVGLMDDEKGFLGKLVVLVYSLVTFGGAGFLIWSGPEGIARWIQATSPRVALVAYLIALLLACVGGFHIMLGDAMFAHARKQLAGDVDPVSAPEPEAPGA